MKLLSPLSLSLYIITTTSVCVAVLTTAVLPFTKAYFSIKKKVRLEDKVHMVVSSALFCLFKFHLALF